MTNEIIPIAGNRVLDENEIKMINCTKKLEKDVLEYVELIGRYKDIDQKWLDIGKTEIQVGFMSLIRAVTRPTE